MHKIWKHTFIVFITLLIFFSGTLKSSRNYSFPITIELIISNNINAKGLIYAKKYDIPFKIFNSSDQKVFEKKCLVELKKKK